LGRARLKRAEAGAAGRSRPTRDRTVIRERTERDDVPPDRPTVGAFVVLVAGLVALWLWPTVATAAVVLVVTATYVVAVRVHHSLDAERPPSTD
jgi:Flp pilus assembly protein TadB